MEDNLNILAYGRLPQYFGKWNKNLNILENRRRRQYFGKQKTTSILWKMEDDINVLKLADKHNFLLGN